MLLMCSSIPACKAVNEILYHSENEKQVYWTEMRGVVYRNIVHVILIRNEKQWMGNYSFSKNEKQCLLCGLCDNEKWRLS